MIVAGAPAELLERGDGGVVLLEPHVSRGAQVPALADGFGGQGVGQRLMPVDHLFMLARRQQRPQQPDACRCGLGRVAVLIEHRPVKRRGHLVLLELMRHVAGESAGLGLGRRRRVGLRHVGQCFQGLGILLDRRPGLAQFQHRLAAHRGIGLAGQGELLRRRVGVAGPAIRRPEQVMPHRPRLVIRQIVRVDRAKVGQGRLGLAGFQAELAAHQPHRRGLDVQRPVDLLQMPQRRVGPARLAREQRQVVVGIAGPPVVAVVPDERLERVGRQVALSFAQQAYGEGELLVGRALGNHIRPRQHHQQRNDKQAFHGSVRTIRAFCRLRLRAIGAQRVAKRLREAASGRHSRGTQRPRFKFTPARTGWWRSESVARSPPGPRPSPQRYVRS